MGDKWATGGLHEIYRQFVHLCHQFRDSFLGIHISCHVAVPPVLNAVPSLLPRACPIIIFLHVSLIQALICKCSEGITAVMRSMVHVEFSHDRIPVAVVVDCSCVMVAVFVGNQVFPILGKPVFD